MSMLVTEEPLRNLSNQKYYGLRLPTIMQDEYLPGYFGRIAKFNRYKDVTKLHMFLSRQTHQSIARVTPILMCLSKLLEIDPHDLWKNHTVYIIKLRQINPEIIRKKLEKSHDSIRNRKNSVRYMPTFFCSKCVEDDVKKVGYTYWRKNHQTLESKFCKTHSNQKLNIALGNDRLYYSPAWHLKENAYETTLEKYY